MTTPNQQPAPHAAKTAAPGPGQAITGSQAIWEALTREGVEVCFGYPGGAIMPAYDALPDYEIHHVLVRHEQGAAHAAAGYARASGKVGVAVATSGPGATNLVTGIADAMLDSIPVVCITGQVASSLLGSDAFQEVDITGITLPITKHTFIVTKPQDIIPTIRKAFYIARSGRPGPVLVDITKDAQQQSTVAPPIDTTPVRLPGYRPERVISPASISQAIEMIHAAERPIIFAGHGIIEGNASQELLEFVSKTDIPVGLTLLGISSFPATHPRCLGMMGMHGEAWVNKAIQESDLIIALGMRFDDRVTGRLSTYAPKAKKIHVELDPAEINKNVKVDLALVGNVREVLTQLNPLVTKRDRKPWLDYIEGLRGDSAVIDIKAMPDNGRLFAAHVVHDLWRITEGKALIVSDVGQHQMWAAQYYKHDYPRKLLTSGGLGTMGFALPTAVGARFAQPHDEIWVIAGDGSFQMTAAELSTLAQEGVKVNIAVINNGYLGMVRQWQQFFYERRYVATPMKSPDFVKLAEAHGHAGLKVTSRDQIADAVAKARAYPGTFLIEFQVEQEDAVYPMVPAGADLADMIRRPAPEGAQAKHNPIYETGEDE